MTQIVVQNTVVDAADRPLRGVFVRVTLIASATGTAPGLLAGTSLTQPTTAKTDSAGHWSVQLTPNTEITPSGTWYVVSENGYTSTIVVPPSGGPYNLKDVVVAVAAPPGTPSPSVAYVDAGDAAEATARSAADAAEASARSAGDSATLASAQTYATAAVATEATARASGDALAAQKANNLSDLASAGSARTNLGLGGAAVLGVGTATGTVAAGDDGRITGAAQKAANLSDLASAATARTNLGLGTAAVKNAPASGNAASGETVLGADTRLADARTPIAHASTHAPTGSDALSGLTSTNFAAGSVDGAAGTASLRTLGAGAQQATAGNDARLSDTRTPTDATVTTAKLADGAVTSAKILDGTIVDADISPSAAIGPSKVSGTALTAGGNLSDVSSPATSRANISAEPALAVAATQTASFTATAANLYPVDATSESITITLPIAAANLRVGFKRIDFSANAVTIQRSGSDVINATGTTTSLALPDEVLNFTGTLGAWWISSGQKSLPSLDARYEAHKQYTAGTAEILASDPQYGTPGTRAAFLNALDAAEALGRWTVVKIPAGLTVDVVGGLSMSGRSAQIIGEGGGLKSGVPVGSVIKASTQTGPVVDLAGYVTPDSLRGRVTPLAGLFIYGDGVADATLAHSGVHIDALGSCYLHDIGIANTGGPCLDLTPSVGGNACYLCDFERIVLVNPVSARDNNVPYLRSRGANGNRFIGLGLRSLASSGDVGASGAVDIDSDSGYASHDNYFLGTWYEFLHASTNAALFSINANTTLVEGTQFFDIGKETGATGTSFFRMGVPSHGSNSGGNIIRGYIPGDNGGTSVSVDTGVSVSQSRNRIEGVRGYKAKNVTLNSGVDYTYACLGGAESGVAGNPSAFVDNSGGTHNVLLDLPNGVETRGGMYVVRDVSGNSGPQIEDPTTPTIGSLRLGNTGAGVRVGSGSPAGVVSAPIGTVWLRTDGSSGTSAYVKESGSGSSGWTGIVSGTPADVQFFTASGTWTKPTGARAVHVRLVGGGGGGGSGRQGPDGAIRCGGGGGASGGLTQVFFDASDLTSTVSVVVGVAGAGGASVATTGTNGANGTGGGNTTFGSYAIGSGGSGGLGGTATTGAGGTGGTGGTSGAAGGAAANTSTTGNGAGASATGSAGAGGGGGSLTAANAAGNGGNGGACGTQAAGGVGAGGVVDATTPTGGTASTAKGVPGPGAGAGAASHTTAAQAGANAVNYGAGGGGGGASLDGNASGAGGSGFGGCALVITHF